MLRNKTLLLFLALLSFSLAACDSAETKEQKYIARGDAYFAEQDYVRAKLEYRNAARISPTNPKILYSLGLVDEAQGNIKNAFKAFIVAEQQDGQFVPALSKLVHYFLAAEQYAEVERRIDLLLSLAPEDADANAIKGSLFLREKKFDKALEQVKKALSIDSTNIIAYSVYTGIYNNQKQPEKAIEVLLEGIEKNPKNLSLHLLLAALYSEQEDLTNLSGVYHKIFEYYPEQIRFRFDLAEIFSKTGEMEQAEAVLRETVKVFPENMKAKHKLATFLEKNKNAVLAEEEIRTYIKEEPEEKIPYLWLADLYIRNNKDALAVETLKNVISMSANDKISLNANTSLAGIQIRKGDIEFASKLIGEVLEKDVNNREALLVRANLSFHQGKREEAVSDLRTILKNHPDETRASSVLAEIFLMQGHVDLAIDTLIQSLKVANSVDLAMHVRLAQLHALQGNQETAESLLALVTKTDPSYAIGWENIARLAIEFKKWDEAEQSIKKLETLDGQENLALFLRGQILEKTGKTKEALSSYRDVIKADPDAALAEYALSAVLDLSKDKETLNATKTFLLSLDTNNPTVSTVLGGMLLLSEEKDKAEAFFKKAIANRPRAQAPYIALAQFKEEEGDIAAALDILEKAEKALPMGVSAPMKRAAILSAQGRVEEAISLYDSLLSRNNELDVAANNMAQLVADHMAYDPEALEKARLIAERFVNSKNLYFIDTLGWVYYRQGHVSQAERFLKRAATELNPPNPQMLYHYGVLLKDIDRAEEAKHFLGQAIENPADFPEKEEAKRLLESIK